VKLRGLTQAPNPGGFLLRLMKLFVAASVLNRDGESDVQLSGL